MSDKPDGKGLTADLQLSPAWSVTVGNDKTFFGFGLNKAFMEAAQVTYLVPAGKRLEIDQVGFYCLASLVASGDLNQMCAAALLADLNFLWIIGANAGFSMSFPLPLVITAGQTFAAIITNHANHNCEIGIIAVGREVDV